MAWTIEIHFLSVLEAGSLRSSVATLVSFEDLFLGLQITIFIVSSHNLYELCSVCDHISDSVQFSSVAQSCLTLYDPMDCSMPGLPVHHHSRSLLKPISNELEMPSNHLILCHPLILPPSIFPSIGVFSNESVLRIRWPKYWSFSFSISPSNEHPGLISFRMD